MGGTWSVSGGVQRTARPATVCAPPRAPGALINDVW